MPNFTYALVLDEDCKAIIDLIPKNKKSAFVRDAIKKLARDKANNEIPIAREVKIIG